jgi:ectoine hydroxylase-related dioxygenase (phytanoyl-CoA dioxygenase family)
MRRHNNRELNKNIFDYKNLIKIGFFKSKLYGASFKNCNLEKCNFWESNLAYANFDNSKLKNCIFTDANLNKTSFVNSTLIDTNLTHTNLKGINFKTAKLINVNLRDAVFDSKTKWPSDFNPLSHGAIKDADFDLFSYKTHMSYLSIKNLSNRTIKNYKKKKEIADRKKITKKDETTKQIIHALTKGPGYYIVKNYYNKNKIKKALDIITREIKRNKNYQKNCSKFSRDKKLNQINIYNLLNLDKVFSEIIQHKIAMDAFKELLGENFVCTYFAAQSSFPGARGQNMHLDYPYVVFNKPGDRIPYYGMGGKECLLSCGLLTYLNNFDKGNSGTYYLENSHKFRKFPTIEDIKKNNFQQVKITKGSILIFNTLMWHGAMPNYSENKNRSVIVAHYARNFVRSRLDIEKTTKKSVIKKDKGILRQLLGINIKLGKPLVSVP